MKPIPRRRKPSRTSTTSAEASGEAASAAAELDWGQDPWRALTDALKAHTGRKGKALFHPLRLALTGRDSGPEMAGLIERMGKERALQRLNATARR